MKQLFIYLTVICACIQIKAQSFFPDNAIWYGYESYIHVSGPGPALGGIRDSIHLDSTNDRGEWYSVYRNYILGPKWTTAKKSGVMRYSDSILYFTGRSYSVMAGDDSFELIDQPIWNFSYTTGDTFKINFMQFKKEFIISGVTNEILEDGLSHRVMDAGEFKSYSGFGFSSGLLFFQYAYLSVGWRSHITVLLSVCDSSKMIFKRRDSDYYYIYDSVTCESDSFIARIHKMQSLYSKDVTFSNVKISPNPVRDQLLVDSEFTGPAEYCIYNLSGKKIKTGSIHGQDIDVSKLSEGIYLIRIRSGANLYLNRFIKI